MSNAESPAERRRGWIIFVAIFAVVAAVLGFTPGLVDYGAWARITLRPPDWAPLLAQPWLVQFHVLTVAVALVLGPVQFVLPKGTALHRALGWLWAGAMFSTAVATLFIREFGNGAFSPVHIFSVVTLIGVPTGIWLARTGRAASHARTMIGLYIGLLIAGLSAVAPGRLIWTMFFS